MYFFFQDHMNLNDKHKIHSYNEVIDKTPSKYVKLVNSKYFELNFYTNIC